METLNDWYKENPEEILERIYVDNFSWLENYVLQNSGNIDDARDVFQEGIIAAWLNLRTGKFYGTADQFNAYVRQICKYKWINQLRLNSRKKDYHAIELHDQHEEALEVAGDTDQNTMLEKCIAHLGEKCKKILNLFYYKKKSLGAIAAEMDNTEESIKTIKYRCMMQLRKLYIEEAKRNGTI